MTDVVNAVGDKISYRFDDVGKKAQEVGGNLLTTDATARRSTPNSEPSRAIVAPYDCG